jgi:SpoIID/LytB domain protein
METFRTIWAGSDLGYLKNIADAPEDFKHPLLPLSTEEKVNKWIDDIPETFCSSKIVNETTLKKYLGSVDEEGKYFRWQIDYSQEQLCDLLNEKLDLSARAILEFRPINRGGSGRLVQIEVLYRNEEGKDETFVIDSDYKIRQTFHKGFLFSSCFYICSENREGEIPQNFIIKGAGWGHGVGYCQIGALGMALKGYATEEILTHYYPGSQLKKIY